MERFENINLAEPFLIKKRYLQEEVQDINITKTIRIAVLTDSTVNNLMDYVNIFLRTKGIECTVWMGDFNKIYDDAVFRIDEIVKFAPTIIFIHETDRSLISNEFEKWSVAYEKIWDSLKVCKCKIIQTNLPLPLFRPIQNGEYCDIKGNVNRILKINLWMADKARYIPYLHLLDLNYISSQIGLKDWYDERLWFMYGCSYSQKIVRTW